MTPPRVVLSDTVFQKLEDAGVFRKDERVRRVVIDLQQGHAPMIYVERFGDERLLNVATTLDGVEIHYGEQILPANT